MPEAAALQAGLELLLHVAGQRPPGFGTQFAERGVVLLENMA